MFVDLVENLDCCDKNANRTMSLFAFSAPQLEIKKQPTCSSKRVGRDRRQKVSMTCC